MAFRKRPQNPPPAGQQPEDRWALLQGEHNGLPLIARVDMGAAGYAGTPQLPVRLGVAVPAKQSDERGFPGEADRAVLNMIEDRLIEAIEGGGTGRLVLVITTGGMREFISYVRSAEEGEAAAQSVRAAAATHEVQSYTADDTDWAVLRQFT